MTRARRRGWRRADGADRRRLRRTPREKDEARGGRRRGAVTLTDASDRRVARHLSNRLAPLRQQHCRRARARGGGGGLGPGVPSTDHDHVDAAHGGRRHGRQGRLWRPAVRSRRHRPRAVGERPCGGGPHRHAAPRGTDRHHADQAHGTPRKHSCASFRGQQRSWRCAQSGETVSHKQPSHHWLATRVVERVSYKRAIVCCFYAARAMAGNVVFF